MLKTGFSLVKKTLGLAGPVPWSDNTAFPISVSVNNPDYFVGLSGGSNVKWTAATLIDYISPNVTIHVDQIADLSLQATYAISDSPQITGLITFYDGSNSVLNVNGSFLQAYYQSEVAPNVNIAQFLVTGITDTGTNEAAELNFGFANTLAGSVSGFFRANISSIGTVQTLFDLRGGDGTYGARASFGSAIQSVSIGLNPNTDPLHHSAIFEIVSQAQSQGVILPNLTDSNINTNISSPATSLLVYNTDYDNFNYFDSSATLRSMLRQDQVTSSNTNLVVTPNLNGSLSCNIVSIPYFSGLGLGLSSGINASAILEIDSTTQGFLLPRMTALQMLNIPSPATGLQIFNLDRGIPYFYDGTGWIPSVVLAGTTNQVNVSFTGFTYTLSTPQNLNNTATLYFGGVGLGFTSGLNPNAILQGSSTTQGFQPPQMTTAQMLAIPITALDSGLTVYVTDGVQGQYICDGTSWDLTGGGGTTGGLQDAYDAGNTIALNTGVPVLISTQGAAVNFAVYSNSPSSYAFDSIEGEQFTSSQSGFITALQYVDAHFSGGSRQVGVYRTSDHVLIASALVDKTDPLDGTGNYRTHAITPVAITAGVSYIVVAIVPASEQWVFYGRSAPTPFTYTGITFGQAASSLVYPTTISPTANVVYYGNQSLQFTPLNSSVSFNDSTQPSLFTVSTTVQGSIPWPLQSTTQFAALSLTKGLSAFDNVLNRPTLYDGTTIQTLAYQSDLSIIRASNAYTYTFSGGL
jgi:hypothetical protein